VQRPQRAAYDPGACLDVADLVRAGRLIRRLLREPLVHFVLLGVALFVLQRAVAPAGDDREIVVPASLADGLARDYARRAAHEPTPEEREKLLQRWIDDEVLYREALALGLDRDDVIVRRRLVQKMGFLLEGSAPVPAPTDADLAAFFAANAQRWARPDRVSIEHVFASYGTPGVEAEDRVTAWIPELAAGRSPASFGDPFMRGRVMTRASEDQLAGGFGADFAKAVIALPEGVWSGPIASSYGAHAVRVTERVPGSVPSLAEIRDAVEKDWRDEQRESLDRQAVETLRRQWSVRIEPDR
jgi:peptidyl-prolyl cis-trans isomerase C